MSEVIRNESNQILDANGHPLEQVAAYNAAERKGAAADVANKKELADAAFRLSTSSPEAYATKGDQRQAEQAEAAANWKGFEHYNANKSGYHEAATEEDSRRTAEASNDTEEANTNDQK